MKKYTSFSSSNDQSQDELSFSFPKRQKKRKKNGRIVKTSVKKAKTEEIHDIQENKRHCFESVSRNISNSLLNEEDDELIGNNDHITTKTFSSKKHDKRNSRKLIEISNKYEGYHKAENILDERFSKAKKKTIKNTMSFFQESDQLKNTNIRECIEVELQEDTNKETNDPNFWSDNLKVSDKDQDPIDMSSDDPLTSPFTNTYTTCTKKGRRKSYKLEDNKNISKNFDVIINSNATNFNNQNDSNLISNKLSNSFERLFKEKISYEHEKKQDITENKSIFNNFKSHILEKLTGRKYAPIVGLDSEYTKLRELLYRTINSGESNTCLIIGPKSSGKSNIVNTAIDSLNEFSSYFFVVRLNGIIQTDDRLALKEIARQLNVKMNLDDKENAASSFSDNLFKILAILSHPRELNLIDDNKNSGEFDSSYNPLSSNITFISVIFVLDNFDLFTQHHRQTLLYNLFDISQTKKAPIAVIGLTCALDSVESLEKRVKSRFSHRIIQIKHPDNLELFIKICRSGLTIDYEPPSELSLEEREKELQFIKNWNKGIDDLFQEGNSVYQLVKKLFMTSKDIRIFYSHCIIPIVLLSSSSLSNLQKNSFFSENLFNSHNKITLLNGISLLQLSLLICAARIDTRDIDALNFNMVYKEYYELVTKTTSSSTFSVIKNTSIRLWERDILLDAWEKLCNSNFLQPCNTNLTNIGGLDRECRMYRVEIILMDLISYIEKVKTIPTILKRWSKDVVA